MIELGARSTQERFDRPHLRQLIQKFSSLPDRTSEQINILNLEQLEALALALLQFSPVTDLENWLSQRRSDRSLAYQATIVPQNIILTTKGDHRPGNIAASVSSKNDRDRSRCERGIYQEVNRQFRLGYSSRP